MSTLQSCVACSTQFAIGLDACPHCGSTEYEVGGVVVARRFPSFVSVSCTACSRGPWTVRLGGPHPGLIELPTLFCASCGSQVQVPWPPKEEPMSPKITVHGGATNARAAEPSPDAVVSPPLVGAEADQGHPTSEDAPAPEPEKELEEEEYVVSSGADAGDDTEVGDPYAGLTLAELRSAADERGVASYGTKAQITERLREADTA
jgi:rRNA maturation protein Nop10